MTCNKMKKTFHSMSAPVFVVGFIWFFTCVSYCPLCVKADDGDVTDENQITGVIKVCGKSAFSPESKTDLPAPNYIDGERKNLESWLSPSYWMSTNANTTFRLELGEPNCRVPLYWTLSWNGDMNNTNSTTHFYPNGFFRNDTDIYAPDEYCIESFFPSLDLPEPNLKIRLCKPDCGMGKTRPCIKKCCPLDKIFLIAPKPVCISPPPRSMPFMPTFYDDINTPSDSYRYSRPKSSNNSSVSMKEMTPPPMPHFIISHPKSFISNCKDRIVIPIPSSETSAKVIYENMGKEVRSSDFRFRTDGAIMYRRVEKGCATMSMNSNTFCVDGVHGAASPDDTENNPFNNTEDEYIIIHCHIVEKDEESEKYLNFTFGVLLVTTSIFPLITSLVYVLLWKKQNVHGWTIAATSGSLFFMYIFQGTAHLIGGTLNRTALNTFYCRFIGVLVHFFMMSIFTWCSVMTFDLFITFRSVVPMNQQRLQGLTRYLKYSAFGWGVPVITVAIGILIDLKVYMSDDCSYHAIPAYGQQSCGLMESSMGVYLYYPAGFLLCVNIALFTATCVKLYMYGRSTTVRSRKNNDAFGECFSRFAKLFCVMGISWIFEIVSWYVDGLGFHWYWNIIDIFNILRAAAVFAIYVCKNDVIKQLEDSYPTLQHIYRPFGRLFFKKCSDEISIDSMVLSAVPNSPATALKIVADCDTVVTNGSITAMKDTSCSEL